MRSNNETKFMRKPSPASPGAQQAHPIKFPSSHFANNSQYCFYGTKPLVESSLPADCHLRDEIKKSARRRLIMRAFISPLQVDANTVVRAFRKTGSAMRHRTAGRSRDRWRRVDARVLGRSVFALLQRRGHRLRERKKGLRFQGRIA
jgi:hypothetical protein